MVITEGARVKINPEYADMLAAPFCHYAWGGHPGTVAQQTRGGYWRVQFDPAAPDATPLFMLSSGRELIAAN